MVPAGEWACSAEGARAVEYSRSDALIMGVVRIAKKTGLIPLDMSLFWPSMMVLAGAWILASTLLRRIRSS